MNEKIKLLAEQAWVSITDSNAKVVDPEKFAKLVIEEYKREVKEDRRATKSKLGYSRIGLKNV